MRRVIPYFVLAGCYSAASPQTPVASPPAARTLPTTLDEGRFEGTNSATTEQFSIQRVAEGWRFSVHFKHGETAADGEMVTDAAFHPLHGEVVQTDPSAKPVTLRLRTENGLLVSEAERAGEPPTAMQRATQKVDWYIGGPITAFLTPVCAYEGGTARPIVFPDTVVEMSAAQPLVVDGLGRRVAVRRVDFPNKHELVVACEDHKVVGMRDAKGSIVVRVGDVAVGRSLEQLPHDEQP